MSDDDFDLWDFNTDYDGNTFNVNPCADTEHDWEQLLGFNDCDDTVLEMCKVCKAAREVSKKVENDGTCRHEFTRSGVSLFNIPWYNCKHCGIAKEKVKLK